MIVGSKPFGESYLLAEMFAQLLEARGIRVERRLGLGATEIAFGALRSGAADVYPGVHRHRSPRHSGRAARRRPGQVYDRVSREFRRRWGMRWLPPLGFENTYAIAVRRATADSLGLRTLSDLARVGPRLRAGLTPDFIGRADGLPGLRGAYGLRFAEVRALLPAVKYQALAAGEVDVIDGYSTDGFIARYDLVVLRDDRRFFPPVRGCGADRPTAGGAAARRGRGPDRARRPPRRGDDATAQPAAGGGRRAHPACGARGARRARSPGRGGPIRAGRLPAEKECGATCGTSGAPSPP